MRYTMVPMNTTIVCPGCQATFPGSFTTEKSSRHPLSSAINATFAIASAPIICFLERSKTILPTCIPRDGIHEERIVGTLN